MAKNTRLRLLSNIVIGYMMVAFAWWTVLLHTKNQDIFDAKAQYAKLVMIAKQEIKDEAEFKATSFYQELERKYTRQKWMILGESIVFIVSLVIGIYLINRGYNEEMKAAQQRRNFLLSITHELKSPLASIKLVLETLKKRTLEKPQVEKITTGALQETERLNTLVNDLLLAARIESAYQVHPEPLNLVELLKGIVEKMQQKYAKHQFSFQSSLSEKMLSIDQDGFTSVTQNLIENAVKYSVDQAVIHLSLKQEAENIVLEFADQGIGISDKEKKRVFDRFYRVGNEDTRKTKGTGLGLYIVKQIVMAHNGEISIMDNSPKGSIFKIILPAKLTKTI